MKRLFGIFQDLPRFSTLARLLCLTLLPAHAQDYTYVTNDSTIIITGYIGPGGYVTIPGTITGLPVTRIGDWAFADCSSLTDITIPNSVTSIGAGAFSYCTSLTNVTIPNNVSSIGGEAFYYCTRLTNVTIPNGVTSIEYRAFYGCTSLVGVTIPNSVTSIGDWAFYDCGELTDATIPNSVTSIGREAFYGCSNLAEVTIPNSVIGIGYQAFYSCSSLTTITVDINNLAYSSLEGVLFDKSMIALIQFPGGKAGSYAIPNGVTSIGDGAFSRCYGLTDITIPNSVTRIGNWAFSFCSRLTEVTIHNGVTSIGESAFYACRRLTTITVDINNLAYSSVEGVLFDKSRITLIQFPGGKAGSYAIPNSVTSIGDWAFADCGSLTDITIPNSVTSIGNWAFSFCSRLTDVKIPNGVTNIGDGTFYYCSSLTEVTIPNGVPNIGYAAFYGCSSLTNVTIPKSVTSIGLSAFNSCDRLTGVYFWGTPPSYGFFVFEASTNLVYYLPGIAGWGPDFGGRPTAIWQLPQPVILTLPPDFGVQTDSFSFRVSWATNAAVVIEASSVPDSPNWLPLATNALVNGWTDFSDPQWKIHPTRFYRVRSQ